MSPEQERLLRAFDTLLSITTILLKQQQHLHPATLRTVARAEKPRKAA